MNPRSLLPPDKREVAGSPAKPHKILMSRIDSSITSAPSAAPDWLVDLSSAKYRSGFFISDKEFAIQHTHRKADVLFVTFDNLSNARDPLRVRDPWGYGFATKSEWSHLGVLSFRPNWFRNDHLFEHLQRLARDGLFKRYRRVVFAGTSMGGYAACAFASLAPGCQVIAYSPQSTLSPEIAPWDERYRSGSQADWSGPYADAATEIGAARRLWLLYDPGVPEDLRHAERLDGPNVTHLRTRYAGHKTAWFMRHAGILSCFTREVVAGTMTSTRFHELYRVSRKLRVYEAAFLQHVIENGTLASKHRMLRLLRTQDRPNMVLDLERHLALT